MDEARGITPSRVSAPGTRAVGELRTRGTGHLEQVVETGLVAALVTVLAWLPAWRTPGFYFHDDMQTQYVPAIVEIGRAARDGRLALLSEYSWFGGALAGEYQHGVFSLPHVLLCAAVGGLGLPTIATIVSVAYYALAGAGAYRAARELEFRRPLAVAVALIAALNGFNLNWGSWLPAITGWAWLMWLWLSLERLRRAPSVSWAAVALSALSTYCVLAAGWHFADVLIFPLVVGVLVRLPRPWRVRDVLRRFGVGPALGTCLALPALLCFLEYARNAGRTDFDQSSSVWTVPWRALAGLVLPLSTAHWSAFGRDLLQSNVVMAGGVLPVVVLLVAMAAPRGAARRPLARLLIAAGLALAWSMLPSIGRVRWPFRWMPVFHLLAAVAAARVLTLETEGSASVPDAERAPRSFQRQLLVAAAGAILVGAVVVANLNDANAIACGVIGLVALALLPLAAFLGVDTSSAFCAAVALNLVASPMVSPGRPGTPTWSDDRCSTAWAKVDRDSRYLGVYRFSDIVEPGDWSVGHNACVLPGNASMLERLTFVNGYSTLYPAGLHRILGLEVHGELERAGVMAVTGPLARARGVLERWGIDGLVLPGEPYPAIIDERLLTAGFRPTEDLGGARIWRRESAAARAPLLESIELADASAAGAKRTLEGLSPGGELFTFDGPVVASSAPGAATPFSKVTLAVEKVTPTLVEAVVHAAGGATQSAALILLRRPYLPGYRAMLDRKPLVLGRMDGALVGVVVPAGASGRLEIEYAPLGVRTPVLIVFFSALLVLCAGLGYDFAAKHRGARQR